MTIEEIDNNKNQESDTKKIQTLDNSNIDNLYIDDICDNKSAYNDSLSDGEELSDMELDNSDLSRFKDEKIVDNGNKLTSDICSNFKVGATATDESLGIVPEDADEN